VKPVKATVHSVSFGLAVSMIARTDGCSTLETCSRRIYLGVLTFSSVLCNTQLL